MARRRIVWRYLVLVVPIVVLLPYFFTGALLIGLSTPALNPESFVSTTMPSPNEGWLTRSPALNWGMRDGGAGRFSAWGAKATGGALRPW